VSTRRETAFQRAARDAKIDVMIAPIGIAGRLLLAFLGILAISLSSAIAAWLILRDISGAQTAVSSRGLPAVTATQQSVEIALRLAAAVPALVASADEAARLANETIVGALAADMRAASERLRTLPGLPQGSGDLAAAADRLIDNLTRQNALVRERLAIEASLRSRLEPASAASATLVDLSETLVSNASSGAAAVVAGLYGLIEDPARRPAAFDALDRLIEHDIYMLDRMFELRLRSSQVGLLLNQLPRATTEPEIAATRSAFADHVRVLNRRVSTIDDPVRQRAAKQALDVLLAEMGPSPFVVTIFGQKERLLAISAELAAAADANNALAVELAGDAQGVLAQAQGFARATAASAEQAVNLGVWVLVLTSLASVLLSGLIVWQYVHKGLLRRLGALTASMQRLAEGDLTVSAAIAGPPELQSMARAVNTFRDVSQARRALEAERERTNEELRRHREDLRELVAERTRQLEAANDALRVEVDQHAEARRRSDKANRAKSEFLATVSHEIRTPMTGMLGMLKVIGAGRLGARQRQQMSIVSAAGQALLGILSNILDYSKIESGAVTVSDEPFRVRPLLEGVVALMQPAAEDRELSLSLDVDAAVPEVLTADAGKVRQVLFNLVSNAVKFTSEGGVRVAGTFAGGALRLTVTDTGPGIDAADRERIFEPFTQGDSFATRRHEGSGLGLAISRRLALAMGGTLSVAPGDSGGSVFTLLVPVVEAAAEDAREAADPLPGSFSGVSALVVEDDRVTQLVVSEFLGWLGVSHETAGDAQDALERLRRHAPDLVLMDISMPGVDGFAALRRIRALPSGRTMPVLAMSAHVFQSEIDSYLEAGFDGFVPKPIDIDRLSQAIATALGRGAADVAGAAVPTRAATAADLDGLRGDIRTLGPATVSRLQAVARSVVPPRLEEISTALRTGDRARVRSLAHALRSAAGSASLPALFEAASALEERADHAPLEYLYGRLAECRSGFEAGMAIWDRELSAQESPANR